MIDNYITLTTYITHLYSINAFSKSHSM